MPDADSKAAALANASGLVGGYLLHRLLQTVPYQRLIVVSPGAGAAQRLGARVDRPGAAQVKKPASASRRSGPAPPKP